jgi:hypothetical protein
MLTKIAIALLFKKNKQWVLPIFASVLSLLLLFKEVGAFSFIKDEAINYCKEVQDVDFWVSSDRIRGDEITKIKKIPEVSKASYFYKANATVSSASGLRENCMLIGVDESTGLGLPLKLTTGNHKIKDDSAILSSECAKSLMIPINQKTKNQTLFLQDQPLKISGVSDNNSSSVVYTSISRARENFQNGHMYICVKAEPFVDLSQLKKKIERVSLSKVYTNLDFQKMNLAEKLEKNKSSREIFSSFFLALIFIIISLSFVYAHYFSSKSLDYNLIQVKSGSIGLVRGLMMIQSLMLSNISYLVAYSIYAILSLLNISKISFHSIPIIYSLFLYLFFVVISLLSTFAVSFKLKGAV